MPFGNFDRKAYNAQLVRRQVQAVPFQPVLAGGVDRTRMIYQANQLRDQEQRKFGLGASLADDVRLHK